LRLFIALDAASIAALQPGSLKAPPRLSPDESDDEDDDEDDEESLLEDLESEDLESEAEDLSPAGADVDLSPPPRASLPLLTLPDEEQPASRKADAASATPTVVRMPRVVDMVLPPLLEMRMCTVRPLRYRTVPWTPPRIRDLASKVPVKSGWNC